ncbi:MAG: hypothetical protein NVSMB52_09460 [Chloroflexota bacterium]
MRIPKVGAIVFWYAPLIDTVTRSDPGLAPMVYHCQLQLQFPVDPLIGLAVNIS